MLRFVILPNFECGPMDVTDLMTQQLITVNKQDPMSLAAELMESNTIKHLPVVDGGGHLYGIISDRDIKRVSPSDTSELKPHEMRSLPETPKVREFMNKRPITTGPRASVQQAAALMVRNAIGGLPVVAETRLVGIVTTTDILKYAARLPVSESTDAPAADWDFPCLIREWV